MRTLRQLSYTGTTLLFTSVGILTMGCSGALDPGGQNDVVDPNDIDGDGIPNDQDPDIDGDGIPNELDPDDDNDGIPDEMDTDITPPPPMGTGGNAGTGGSTGAGGSGTGGVIDVTCTPGVPATSQVPRIKNRVYDNVMRDVLGMTTLSDGSKPSDLLNADSEGDMNAYQWIAYQKVAGQVSSEVMAGPNKANFVNCDPAVVATCYEDTIKLFGRKIFRRPLTPDEVTSFMRLTTIEPAGTPDEILEAILYAFLVSPSFIMATEMSTEEMVAGAIKLNDYEVAQRLALTLWGSAPDQTLNEAADAGMLGSKDQVAAQAARMIQDGTKAGDQVAAAHQKFLKLDMDDSHWFKQTQDSALYPEYSPAAKEPMRAEIDEFFKAVVFDGGKFEDLFLSGVAFVNKDTAAIYGLNPADYGAELTQVELDPAVRPGFLTRAGFLSSFSHADATSPILRGAFVTVEMIGVDPGPPDPAAIINAMVPTGAVFDTERGKIEALTSAPSCAKCHGEFVNPPGFVLENFNAIGKWQDVDPIGGAINSTAEITLSDGTKQTVSSALEMMQAIASGDKPRHTYVERLVSFYMNRFPNPQDACIVDEASAKLAGDGYTILNLIAELTQADSFSLRTVGN